MLSPLKEKCLANRTSQTQAPSLILQEDYLTLLAQTLTASCLSDLGKLFLVHQALESAYDMGQRGMTPSSRGTHGDVTFRIHS